MTLPGETLIILPTNTILYRIIEVAKVSEKNPDGINSLSKLRNFSDEGVSRTDSFGVDPTLLLEEEGFNPRGSFAKDYWSRPDVVAHVRGFADSYKRGAYVPPIAVIVRNADIIVRDGHHRRRGLLLAMAEGATIKKVQVVEVRGDEIQHVKLTLTSAAGRHLAPLDKAVQYQKFIAWGYTIQELAAEIGTSAEHVRTTLPLVDLPLALKEMIAEDQIAAHLALDLYNQYGDKALGLVAQAYQNLVDEEAALKQEVENLALGLDDEVSTDPVAAKADSPAKNEGDVDPAQTSDNTDPESASAPAPTSAKPAVNAKPIKVTAKHVNKLLPTAPKIGKKTVQFVHRGFETLSTTIDDIKREGDHFVMKLTVDQVDLLKKIKAELAAAGASVESQGETTSKDSTQGDMVDQLSTTTA